MARSGSMLMTKGPIRREIILFTIPLFFSNLFQQLYNTADSIIVGNFTGADALAAVSSSGNLIFLVIGFIIGLSTGAGVVIARHYGAGEKEGMRKAVNTVTAMSLCCGLIAMLLGILFAPLVLVWMGTPETVLPESILYFRIYFIGAIPATLYNGLVGVLQAVGDSRHPMFYLILSSIVNIVLDLLFVGVFHFGVAGAAAATVISQVLSMVMAVYHLLNAPDDYRLIVREVSFDKTELKDILYNGIPMGLQNCIIAFANVIVQSYINQFGRLAVAGQGAYLKIEGFAFLPITCFSMAMVTFIGQNVGAGEKERVRQGARFGLIACALLSQAIGILMYIFAHPLIRLFGSDEEMIAYGVERLRICIKFYIPLSISHVMAGILRGAGKSVVPMVVMLVCWCVIRVPLIGIGMHYVHSINVVNWAYPITWMMTCVVFLVYYFSGRWLSPKKKDERKTVSEAAL